MDPEAPKLSVWLCQEEKLISGLSKRTTCADVVRALLEDSRAAAAGGRRRARRGAPAAQQHAEPEPLPAGPPSSSSLSSSSSSQERVGGGGVPLLSGPPASYCLVEKWRGFERILPAKTRLLRLWAAWGPEQENVRFVLLRSEASLPSAGPRSAEARVVPSKERPSLRPRAHATLSPPPSAPRAPGPALNHERQRRLVRKAFRKLAKLNRRKGGSSPPLRPPPPPQEGGGEEEGQGGEEEEEEASPSGELPPPASPSPSSPAERMETLVHLVLSQDHTIRQQLKRLRDLDREIDRYEARTHFDRMQRHGVNYVQETYLEGGEGPEGEPPREQESAEREGGEGEAEAALALYERRCAQVAAAVEQRGRQEALLERLALEIQEELNQRWMRRRRDELRAARGPFGSLAQDPEGEEEGEADGETTELTGVGGGELPVEQERLRTQLSTSLYIGLRLSTDLEAVKGQLEATRRACERKERQAQALAHTLQALEAGVLAEEEEDEEEEEEEEDSAEPPQTAGTEAWDQVSTRTVGKAGPEEHEDDGEDSDTGLSSMHSQDSDSVPVCESLV
ncbi:ras association domain-containing protein 10 [Anolis sagrei]|uniref:ras association domain-containing protein 10 n=1 Tax=Anolis sagrei TaxID=38937 RepID=UPI00351FCC7F